MTTTESAAGGEGLFLEQLEPGPAAIRKGVAALLDGITARRGGKWVVISLPDELEVADDYKGEEG